MATLTYRQLLTGNRSFRNLWAGQVVSELGNWFNFVAGLGLVRAVTNASPEATAILVILRMMPFALFAPLAGAFVDRWPRRAVMLASDAARAVLALGFIFVRDAGDIWIAYACTVLSTLLAAFFEAARNAAMPNVVGDRGLLAGNALMFSSRFLLMSVGSALGGTATFWLGYEVAFVVNALSFVVSAYSVWLVPESDLRASEESAVGGASESGARRGRLRVFADVRDGWAFIARHRLVAALIGINILWATGGAHNLIYDRLGVIFSQAEGWNSDAAVAAIYTTVGAGLFIGMMLARRIGSKVELRGATPAFIGWTLIAHGIFFALAGLMPTLWAACLMILLSRAIVGVEFAVQETLLMRMLPDDYRGRVSTTDRAAEIMMVSIATAAAGRLLDAGASARALTVASGLLSATPGVMWLLLFAAGKLSMPARRPADEEDGEAAALASAG
jgi:MFS family permease